MSPKVKFYIGAVITLIILNMTCRRSFGQDAPPPSSGSASGTDSSKAESKPAKLFGEFTLTTNYIEHGITKSASSLAMQPELGYFWGDAARAGLWTSNVQFPTNSESLHIKLFGWYKFVFSPSYDLKIRADLNKYFASANRDGTVLIIDFNWDSHHIVLEQISNWFGTNTAAVWLGYDKTWKIIWDMDYKLTSGYTIVNSRNYNGYIDIKTGLGYKYAELYYELMMSINSAASQFAGGLGESAFYLQITAKF